MVRDEVRVPDIEEPVPRAQAEADAGPIDAERPRPKPLWDQLRQHWSRAAARPRRG
jgi:hypothetical protein